MTNAQPYVPHAAFAASRHATAVCSTMWQSTSSSNSDTDVSEDLAVRLQAGSGAEVVSCGGKNGAIVNVSWTRSFV